MKIFRTAKRIVALAAAVSIIYTPFGIANNRFDNYTEKLSQLENVDNASVEELEKIFIEISEARSEAAQMSIFLPEEKRERLGNEGSFGIIEEITEVIAEIDGSFINIIK